MATTYVGKSTPIRGPYLKHAFAKYVLKGEDAWLQQRDVDTSISASKGLPACLDVLGIFDGHGGKQIATYAAKHLMPALLKELSSGAREEAHGIDIHSKHPHGPQGTEGTPKEQLATCDAVKPEERSLWEAQDILAGALPQALAEAFQSVEHDFLQTLKVSGTTATVAAFSGWEVVIANVGDSCAYMDTGVEVVLVSGNHRLDDNKVEQKRLSELGRELSSSAVEGRPVGPLRVWPGGLAMSRTLGDAEAGAAVTAEPEVRQVTLPLKGARIVLASDGLWDAVNPKTAMHHIRTMPASKAATELMQMAVKSKGQRDDITVIVIDALPSEDMRVPPALQQKKSTSTMVARSAGSGSLSSSELLSAISGNLTDQVTVLKPLEVAHHDALWRAAVWERRLVAVQTTYGALLPPDMMHSSSDMSTTLMLSDAHISTSMGSGSLEIASEFPADTESDAQHLMFGSYEEEAEQDAEDEWETVPTKSKGKKHAADGSAASSPNNVPHGKLAKADTLDSEVEAPPAAALEAVQQHLGSGEHASRSEGGGHSMRGRGRGRGRRGRQGMHSGRGGRRQQAGERIEGFVPAPAQPVEGVPDQAPEQQHQGSRDSRLRRSRPRAQPAQHQGHPAQYLGRPQPPAVQPEFAMPNGMVEPAQPRAVSSGNGQTLFVKRPGSLEESANGDRRPREQPGRGHARNGPRTGGRGHRGRRASPFMHGPEGPLSTEPREGGGDVRDFGHRQGGRGRGYPGRRRAHSGEKSVHQQAVPVAANA